MRNDNKGFTLIELLAVIIILAIVALITTPIILNIVNSSRESAAEDKAWGYIDGIRLAYTQDQMNDYPEDLPITKKAAVKGTKIGEQTIQVSGDYPTGGTFSISKDGEITVTAIVFGNYKCTGGGSSMSCPRTAK